MRLSHEEIKQIILSVDDSRITEQMLQQLLKFLPGAEQISQFQGMRGILSELSEAERFGVVVSVCCVCACMCMCACACVCSMNSDW